MPTKPKSDYQQPTHVIEARHVNMALDALTHEQRPIVCHQARRLADGAYDTPGIRNMDNGIALEVLARIGILL